MESEVVHAFNRRTIQNFMDIIILKYLKNHQPITGYDIIKHLHRKFHILPSAGTIYSILYALERQSLIAGKTNGSKRLYNMTNHGEELLKTVSAKKDSIQQLFSYVFAES